MGFEDLCRRCGRCCSAKLIIDGRVHYTPFFCRYLDVKTRLCTIYDRRHETNPDCLSLEEGILMGVFPADCPYVRDLPQYRPPVEQHTDVTSLFEVLKLAADESERARRSADGLRPPTVRPLSGRAGPEAGGCR